MRHALAALALLAATPAWADGPHRAFTSVSRPLADGSSLLRTGAYRPEGVGGAQLCGAGARGRPRATAASRCASYRHGSGPTRT